MRKLALLLSVAFALLFAQQGRLLHELEHAMHRPAGQVQAQDLDRCDLCLAFAHIAGVAPTPELAAAPLRADLSFPQPAPAGAASAQAIRVAPRSRGPPISL